MNFPTKQIQDMRTTEFIEFCLGLDLPILTEAVFRLESAAWDWPFLTRDQFEAEWKEVDKQQCQCAEILHGHLTGCPKD